MKKSGQRRILVTASRKENNIPFTSGRKLGGPKRGFGGAGKEKNLLTLSGIELRFLTSRNTTTTERTQNAALIIQLSRFA
jgi:hypothetical protein